MEQNVEFINEWLTQKYTITELCRSFKITRHTAYKLISRNEKMGLTGLIEQERAPINHPNRTDQKVEDSIENLKNKHLLWGAKKIRILSFQQYPEELIPIVVTVHDILSRNCLVKSQKWSRSVKAGISHFDLKKCNEVWSADYKGKFLMGNKIYCHPLTIADSKSRFLFTAKGHYKENFQAVKQEFTKVFRKYIIPKQIHPDKGSPFGSVSASQRYTRLSYWFIELEINPVYSDPARPEQNGRYEHMHCDLKATCAKPSSFGLKSQQRSLNRFVKEYYHVRPHEFLGMKTPADCHDFSTTPYPEKISNYD